MPPREDGRHHRRDGGLREHRYGRVTLMGRHRRDDHLYLIQQLVLFKFVLFKFVRLELVQQLQQLKQLDDLITNQHLWQQI